MSTSSGAGRHFRRVAAASLLGGALAVAILGAVAAGQGPRAGAALLDAAAASERAGETLTLVTNQRLHPSAAAGVRVVPAVAFSAEVVEGTLRLSLGEALAADREYRVLVPGARGADTGVTAELDYRFRTPPAGISTLERRPGQPDRVRLAPAGAGAERTLIEAAEIREFAVAGDTVAVLRGDPDGRPRIEVRSEAEPTGREIFTNRSDRLSRLALSAGFLGYLDGQSGTAELRLIDLSAGSGTPPAAVGDGAGAPLLVRDWWFFPGQSYALAETSAGALVLVDPLDPERPRPLSDSGSVLGVLPGSAALRTREAGGVWERTADGRARPAEPARPLAGGAGWLPVAGGWVAGAEPRAIPGGASAWAGLRVTDGAAERELFRPAAAGSAVLGACASPNGRLLAVTVLSAEGDPLPGVPGGFSASATTVIDATSGETLRRLPGVQADWCRAGPAA